MITTSKFILLPNEVCKMQYQNGSVNPDQIALSKKKADLDLLCFIRPTSLICLFGLIM